MPNQTPPHSDRRPVAYLNEKFLNSPDARALRILSEFLEPLAHFRREKVRDTVVFFGSARLREDGPLAQYYQDARTLAKLLTEWAAQFTNSSHRFVVCSGGGPGIMEAANRGAHEANGITVGLNIENKKRPNPFAVAERVDQHPELKRRDRKQDRIGQQNTPLADEIEQRGEHFRAKTRRNDSGWQ